MTDPETTVRRLHEQLARTRPELADLRVPSAEELRAVLDPALMHQRDEPEVDRLYLTPPQLALLEALENGSALDLDPVPALSAGAQDLLAAHQRMMSATRSLEDRLAAEAAAAASVHEAYDQLLAVHQKTLLSAAEDRQSAQEALASNARDHRRAQEALASNARDYRRAQEALATGAADLERARKKLRRALTSLDELDHLFSAILASRSWKIGRAITAAWRRFLGGSKLSVEERRDQLMAEVRKWRRDDPQE